MHTRWTFMLGLACWLATATAQSALAGCTVDADCEDQNPCTENRCSSRGRCLDPVVLAEPQSSCTPGVEPPPCLTDVCTPEGACMRVAKCEDADPCTEDRCDEHGVCAYAHRPDGASCAGACATPGTCHNGVCQGTQCDDENPCTDDRCGVDGLCIHTPTAAGAFCAPDQNDCWVSRCDGRGSCKRRAAAENATCLILSAPCLPWGLCKGGAQERSCERLSSACVAGQPCATDGADCSGTTPCGLTSTCRGGTCVDLTCDVGAPMEPCGVRCGSEIVGNLCTLAP